MTQDILATLHIAPEQVPELPAAARTSLISYLLRWEHYEEARRCLQQLLVTHSHLVSIYDELARAYLGLGQPDRALEITRRRQAIKESVPARSLEVRARLAAGDVAGAQAIAQELATGEPEMVTVWTLQAEVCLAAGDRDGAEAALKRREALTPEASATAHALARVWEARGDAEKALLWARTALSRAERDERKAPVELLRLLERLYEATGQPAQAGATRGRIEKRRREELEEVKGILAGQEAPRTAPSESSPPRQGGRGEVPSPSGDTGKGDLTLTPTLSLRGRGRQSPSHLAGRGRQRRELPPLPQVTAEERARLEEALHRHFPHVTFRTGQMEAIAPVLRGEQSTSVLAVMPTGAGKSLCYQLAAMMLPGTTLVISPLVALMKDQLDGLPGPVAAQSTTLNYTLDGAELEARLDRAAGGGYKLIYAAPERLRQRPFLHALKRAGVSLLVVDEAHCVSLWGHDFRPDYLFIEKAWQELGRPPIMGLTATATPRVRDDIQAALGTMELVATDVQRPNLHLEARHFLNDEEKTEGLIQLCRELEGSGIVYANSRLRCEQLATTLRRAGVKAIHYHAGLDDRAAAQDRFMSGQARVVVATIAFGMGIDKADVRFIVHYHPPRALENYYQEAGRAGRDGLPAHCILFHAGSDKANLTRWTRQGALSVEYLRQVYDAIRRRLPATAGGPGGAGRLGIVALADLERDLAADDETRLRVAIHFLESAGLVRRGFDLPRTAALTLKRRAGEPEPELARFAQAARLRPEQPISRELPAAAREAGLDARTVEGRLLAWSDEGWLDYRGIGRDMLLELPEPPADSRERVAALLADYLSGQEARIAEVVGYAGTRSCRHGYISAYFGGREIERCGACDNCVGALKAGAAPRPPVFDRPAAVSSRGEGGKKAAAAAGRSAARAAVAVNPKWAIVKGVQELPYAVGATTLARALTGMGSSKLQADRFPMFGALAGRAQKSVGELIGGLVDEGLIAYFRKGDFRLLRLTEDGQTWLKEHGSEAAAAPGAANAPELRPGGAAGTPPRPASADPALGERLRAWRLKVARETKQAPFMVLSNSTLVEIAACRPETLKELAAVKGIGPCKLEQYGQEILGIVAGNEPE